MLNMQAAILAAVSLAGAGSSLLAAEARERYDDVYIRGGLEVGDLDKVDLTNKRRIIFEHSLGGTYAAAMHYVEKIKKYRLDTVVKGKCYSACAISFMAGARRDVDTSGGISALSFHSARIVVEGGVRPYPGNDQLVAKINELADGKITPEVLALIRSSWSEAAGVVFVFYPKFLFVSVRGTVYCDGSQGTDLSKCKALQHADAYDMGVLTRD